MKVVNTGHFCPVCGAKQVHVDQDDSGDYYAGTSHWCLACHSELPDLGGIKATAKGPLDDFMLGKYIAIRDAAGHDADDFRSETDRLRKAQADAISDREARWKDPVFRPSPPFNAVNK